MYEFENIENMAEWARNVSIGQLRIGYLPPESHDSFNSSTSRENGKFKAGGEDKWIKHWINKKQNRVAVYGMTRAEHEESEKKINNNNDEYDKILPQGFLDPTEEWEVGSWYA